MDILLRMAHFLYDLPLQCNLTFPRESNLHLGIFFKRQVIVNDNITRPLLSKDGLQFNGLTADRLAQW